MDSKDLLKSIESSMDDLAAETDEVKISAGFLRYLNSISRFYSYSLMNQILIWIQKPGATRVAGYKTWQTKFHRTVKKGEKGIAILAPVTYKPKEKTKELDLDSSEVQTGTLDTNTGEAKSRPHLYFRIVYVFDESQTEGEPLPEEPNWHSTEKSNELELALVAFAHNKGIKVEIVDDLDGADGVSTGGKIVLLPTAGTHAMIHELAHEMLHQDKAHPTLSRQEREIEADATAYVVSKHFNVNAEASPNYLALWKANGKEIRDCLTRVRLAAVEMITFVEGCYTEVETGEVEA
jgi:hypothetical protein